MIETFFRKIKAGELPCLRRNIRPHTPKHGEYGSRVVGGTPFTMNDDKPDLFADLDA